MYRYCWRNPLAMCVGERDGHRGPPRAFGFCLCSTFFFAHCSVECSVIQKLPLQLTLCGVVLVLLFACVSLHFVYTYSTTHHHPSAIPPNTHTHIIHV